MVRETVQKKDEKFRDNDIYGPVHVLGGRLRLYQPQEGFRTSLDSLMLAAALPATAAGDLLDMGCGVGGSGLAALFRCPALKLTGIEKEESYIKLAWKNAGLNEMKERALFRAQDIIAYGKSLKKPLYDYVICNPPYYGQDAYIHSPVSLKDKALGHAGDGIEDWIKAALYCLRPGGVFCLIHRAEMLDRILGFCSKRFGYTEIMPLWPRQGGESKRVVIRTVKGRKSPCRLYSGLVLHGEGKEYTIKADMILRGEAGLFDIQ